MRTAIALAVGLLLMTGCARAEERATRDVRDALDRAARTAAADESMRLVTDDVEVCTGLTSEDTGERKVYLGYVLDVPESDLPGFFDKLHRWFADQDANLDDDRPASYHLYAEFEQGTVYVSSDEGRPVRLSAYSHCYRPA